MKTLTLILMFLIGVVTVFNLGMTWGMTSKPVLNMDKCKHIVRYEDNSLRCLMEVSNND